MRDEKDFEKFYAYLTQTKRLMERSVEHYLSYYVHLDPALLSQEYVNAFVQEHGNNSVVRGFMLSYLHYRGMHKQIDMPDKPKGKTLKRMIRGISQDEIKALSDFLHGVSFKKGLIFDLLYQGALRRAEIPTIRINSFKWMEWMDNMNGMCKLIVLGKGNKERVVLINPETAESILNKFVQPANCNMETLRTFANSSTLLFSKKNGNQIAEYEVWEIVKKGSIKCLGRDIRTHELRHCRATELEKRGVSIKDIKNYLGHSNLATTEIYLHRSESESIKAIEGVLKQ